MDLFAVAVPANYAPAYEYDAIPVHATQFHAQVRITVGIITLFSKIGRPRTS